MTRHERERLTYDLDSLNRALDHERDKRNHAVTRDEYLFAVATINWLTKAAKPYVLRLHPKKKKSLLRTDGESL